MTTDLTTLFKRGTKMKIVASFPPRTEQEFTVTLIGPSDMTKKFPLLYEGQPTFALSEAGEKFFTDHGIKECVFVAMQADKSPDRDMVAFGPPISD